MQTRQAWCIRARVLFEEALAVRRVLKAKVGIAYSLNNVACTTIRLGDYDAALAAVREGLPLDMEIGDKGNIAWDLTILGAVAAARGDPVRGARLLGAAKAIYDHTYISLGTEEAAYEHYVEIARTQLDEETFAKAWAEGQALTLERAIDESEIGTFG